MTDKGRIRTFTHGTTKEFDGATIESCNLEGKKVMKMHMHPGFDWNKAVGLKMPGCPTLPAHALWVHGE
jgi:hypothetical protein